ncbi:MAG: alpha/beta hydrolase-fold protein [Terracidiphilus sp.]|jgi:esterase/lipase superfamily enzyme
MLRKYHKGHSKRLGREMEALIFGHAGLPVVVFPSSRGRFYEFEDQGMIAALSPKIDAGQLQLFCVDSVDAESWYNRAAPPRFRIARHMQYEEYLIHEALPVFRQLAAGPHAASQRLVALGCSFGGYHAVNIALRHPEIFTGFVSLSGAFDLSAFLHNYYDEDCYFHLPTHYLPNLTDPRFLDSYRRASYVLATGWDDQCLAQNQQLDKILNEKEIPHQLCIWDSPNSHSWPIWQRMAKEYL